MKKLTHFITAFVLCFIVSNVQSQHVNVYNGSNCDVTIQAVVQHCSDCAYTPNVVVQKNTTVTSLFLWSNTALWTDCNSPSIQFPIAIPWEWSHLRISVIGGGTLAGLGAPTSDCLGLFDTPVSQMESCAGGLLTASWNWNGSSIDVYIY
jgi:hypothetical protein